MIFADYINKLATPTMLNILTILTIIGVILYLYYSNFAPNSLYENFKPMMNPDMTDELKKQDMIYDRRGGKIVNNHREIPFKFQFNLAKSVETVDNKILTNQILRKNGIPAPNSVEILKTDHQQQIWDKIKSHQIKFPMVVKQIFGKSGVDVRAYLTTKSEVDQVIQELFTRHDKLMVESHYPGNCYRVLVFDDKIMDIVKREQPFVIGDGISTLKKLFDARNQSLSLNGRPKTRTLDVNYTKHQGYDSKDIPPKDKKIYVSATINYHNGAVIDKVQIDDIPEINKKMFIKAHQSLKMVTSGIDYLSPDITKPYTSKQSNQEPTENIILEVNGRVIDFQIHEKVKSDQEIKYFYHNFSKKISEYINRRPL